MRQIIITIILAFHLVGPAFAQVVRKDPLSYAMKEYAAVLFMTILGGFVGWYNKVRKGEVPHSSLFALIGEMATSSLAGLGSFLICDWLNCPLGITAAICGLCGYMGGRAIEMAERRLERKIDGVAGDSK